MCGVAGGTIRAAPGRFTRAAYGIGGCMSAGAAVGAGRTGFGAISAIMGAVALCAIGAAIGRVAAATGAAKAAIAKAMAAANCAIYYRALIFAICAVMGAVTGRAIRTGPAGCTGTAGTIIGSI